MITISSVYRGDIQLLPDTWVRQANRCKTEEWAGRSVSTTSLQKFHFVFISFSDRQEICLLEQYNV